MIAVLASLFLVVSPQAASLGLAPVACEETDQPRRLARRQEPFDSIRQHYSLGPAREPLVRIEAVRNRKFYSQPILVSQAARSRNVLVLDDGRRFEPDGGYLIRATWTTVRAPIYIGDNESVVAGEVFCNRGRLEGRPANRFCFQDRDGDGRFEAAADVGRLHGVHGPSRLQFRSIEPQAYATTADVEPSGSDVEQALSLMTSRSQDGQLRILLWLDIDPVLTGFRPGVNQSVLVDDADLPAEVELLGARLLVHGFDGGRADITVERQFETGRLEFDRVCPGEPSKGLRITIGSADG